MARGKSSRSASNRKSRQKMKSMDADDDPRPMEERLKAIEYHWSNFTPRARRFLLQAPDALTIQKFLTFFSQKDELTMAEMEVSVATAHLLAYEYFNIKAYENAKALTLCGAFFLQCQCPDTPIEKMSGMAIKDPTSPTDLKFYYDGSKSTRDETSMSSYLKKVLPLKYQKMLAFESHSSQAPGMKYVDLISNDWNRTSRHSAKHQEGGNNAEITIVLSNKDDETEYKKSIKMGTTLKSLFNGYADECGVSLRALRFSYSGRTLFLSSLGQKTPMDLGMKDMDVVVLSKNEAGGPANEARLGPKPKAQPKPRKRRPSSARGKNQKKRPMQHQTISIPKNGREHDKLEHSKLLSRVFEEMQPILKVVRRRLNELAMDRQSSKAKRPLARTRRAAGSPSAESEHSTVGFGAKAGRTSFAVNVGRAEYLYKTSKRDSGRPRRASTIDLHGCTKEEALVRLGASLREWVDVAMHGSYPWVIPATIVCGAGNQILAETVEDWIRETREVANAPKGSVLVR